VCALDLEGIVAKHKLSPDVADRESSTWFKILNPAYSQRIGRKKLFERGRHREPVPGWHACAVACEALRAGIGRPINPTVYSVAEFKSKRAAGNHFLTAVLQGQKVFLLGDEDELRKVGGVRLAKAGTDQPR
jgi:hypothetical protein